MKKILLLIFSSLVLTININAQPFSLVKDINVAPNDYYGNPFRFFASNNTVFFAGKTNVTGVELWKTDGTSGGSVLVRDINKGMRGSNPRSFVTLNNVTYFIADAINHETGLPISSVWKTDGTSAGTMMVKDISTDGLVVMNGSIYFVSTGSGLWKSDGSSAGTSLVKQIPATGYYTVQNNLIVIGNRLFFCPPADVGGYEVWTSDGTEAGTILLKGTVAGIYSVPGNFTEFSGSLFFTARGPEGTELWKSDGTPGGTVLVKDIFPGAGNSDPMSLMVVNGELFFSAIQSAYGRELWKSDGTEAGTVLVKDIISGNQGSSPQNLTKAGNSLFFTAYTISSGLELWKSDGTEAGTILVKDILTGMPSASPQYLSYMGGTLYFTTQTAGSLPQLWKSDGTESGTLLVKTITEVPPGYSIANMTVVNDKLYFSPAYDANGNLWTSDGTAAGTILIKDINGGNFGSNPEYLTDVNGVLFFTAGEGVTGNTNNVELWKSDGTEAGTLRVRDIYPGAESSRPANLINLNGTLFFSAEDELTGTELWRSDGTDAGTSMVKDIAPGTFASSGPRHLTVFNGALYFTASTSNVYGLWKSDGTEAGTNMVKDVAVVLGQDFSKSFPVMNGNFYFAGYTPAEGYELWKSDGTEAGTVTVKNIVPGPGLSSPRNFTVVDGTLFFLAQDAASMLSLWKTDGTEAGTILLKEIGRATGDAIFEMTNLNGLLMLSHGYTPSLPALVPERIIWKSDGTVAGTVVVKTITQSENRYPGFIRLNNKLFFSGYDGSHGWEIWSSDGTTNGTGLFADIFPGIGSSFPSFQGVINGNLVFTANDGIRGEEIWQTNGTTTTFIQDIEPTGGSNPRNFTRSGLKVFCTAETETNSVELWVTTDVVLPVTKLDFTGRLLNDDALLTWRVENELNADKYIVERSIDGISYRALGSVRANNTTAISRYNFTDPRVNLLGKNFIYYRLKQADMDGRFTYSPIVILSVDRKNNVLLYPNPVGRSANLTITVNEAQKVQCSLFNNLGETVHTQSFQLSAGPNFIQLNTSHIARGNYIIQLKGTTLNEVKNLIKD